MRSKTKKIITIISLITIIIIGGYFAIKNNNGEIIAGSTSSFGTGVPYVGANKAVNLGSQNLTTTGTGTFGSTYQAILGDGGNTRAGYFEGTQGHASLGTNAFAGSFGSLTDAFYAEIATPTYAGYFEDSSAGHNVYLADGTYAINAVGTIAGLAAMTTNTPSILFFPTFTYSAADDYLAPFSFYAGDYRTTTGASANFNVFTINSDKNGAYSATNDSLTALSMAVNDGGTYNTGTSSIESISFSLLTSLFPIIDVGAGNTVTHNAYGSQIYVGVIPTISSGTYVGNYYGHFIDVAGATGGTTTAYGVYINSVGGADTNWGFYNKTSVNNQFSIGGSKSGFGLANGTVPTAKIHIGAGTATAGSAPIKFTSGSLTTAAVEGQMEFLTDDYYITETNNAVRKLIVGTVASADLTAQTAAKSATTIYTPGASRKFRVSIILQVTTAATTSSVLGGATGVVITYTEPDGSVAQSIVPLLTSQAGAVIVPATGNTGNTTATQSQGSAVINAKVGVAIQYAIGYTSVGLTPMAYAAHLKVEAM